MKNKRQQTLLHIVQTRTVHSQEELQALLKGRGFNVTQATVSRDIKDLGLVKAPYSNEKGQPSSKYALQGGARQGSRLQRFINELVESISGADNFVVIKTAPRCALMVGSELDKAAWPELMGTITGDDTIFCISPSRGLAARAIKKLNAMKR